MKLQPRTTYRTRGGATVHVVGPSARPRMEGLPLYWTLRGDFYAEDGRLQLGRVLTEPDSPHNLVREDHDPTFWEGISE